MNRIITTLLVFLVFAGFASAQRAKIYPKAVTPHKLSSTPAFGPDSTVSNGMTTVPNKTFVYLEVVNFGDNTAITNATWVFLSKPSGSTASLTTITGLPTWIKFKADLTGTYEVKVTMTTSSGTKDTTEKIYSANYVGTGNFGGVPAQYPNCMTCHAGMPTSLAIFNRWKVSGHANMFRYMIDSGSAYYGISCMKCHTTGYDHNIYAENNGFDDKARDLGWVWSNYSPPKTGNWDSLKTYFSGLVPFASIGCENCHGPGSEHTGSGGDTLKIVKDYSSNSCSQCHDEPWRHPIYGQWENAKHSEALWSNSFAQSSSSPSFGTNDLGNCIRCHDARGYINFTNSIGTNTQGMTAADHNSIGCATCHDPHGNSNEYSLRNRPAGSDTLANGYSYSSQGGNGKTCMSCHKSRRDNVSYTQTRVNSSHWGPHHSTQSDVLLGKNAAQFGPIPYLSGSHKNVVSDGCVTCHMAPTTDTGTVSRDKVGGHSLSLHYEATDYDHVAGCQSCHSGVTSFEDFMAPDDFDGDNQVESWKDEIAGVTTNLRIALPPVGVDSVAWQLIAADSFNVNLRKAYWNYQLISYEGSGGMHNPFFSVNVLLASIYGIIGIEYTWNETPQVYNLSQNYPNPFNPTTQFTFSIPKSENVSIRVYDLLGREVTTLVNSKVTAGKYTVSWNGRNSTGSTVSSGVYFYRIEAGSFVQTRKMVMVK